MVIEAKGDVLALYNNEKLLREIKVFDFNLYNQNDLPSVCFILFELESSGKNCYDQY
jgi:hypothetical protein